MSTITKAKSRTVRIEDHIWEPFTQKAKQFGFTNTAYLKIILMKTNQSPISPDFLVGENEEVKMNSHHQELSENIMKNL